MNKALLSIIFLLFASLLVSSRSEGSGFYGPTFYLENGGENVLGSPEFYWELELKRLARDYHPTETLNKILLTNQPYSEVPTDISPLKAATASADSADFEAAIKSGEIKTTNSESAIQENKAARDFILSTTDKTTGELPPEVDSEFSDYHKGAFAYARGKDHWDEAKKAWEQLLQRPENERHYRSVWAAFMLGKLALKNNDPEAIQWFEKVRELAKAGYVDSLGMAADSYGWEGRSQWKQGHSEKAAPLFLTQLALGDQSAIVSLKALIPDRAPIDGMLNFGPESEVTDSWSDEQKKAADDKAFEGLKVAAADPLLRRLITVHILSAASISPAMSSSSAQNSNRSKRWLSVISDAHIDAVEDAEYLGWVAYSTGNYKEAARWLKLAKADSPATCWLRSKLELRDGKTNAALQDMTKALDSLKDTYTSLDPSSKFNNEAEKDRFVYSGDGGTWQFSDCANGDLAALHLTRGDFIQSLDAFMKGGLLGDASFVAESVLTTDELKAYVDKGDSRSASKTNPSDENFQQLRNLLGRRLVRDGRTKEAESYLTAPYGKIAERYAKALHDGKDEKLSKKQRAEAYFTAAWLARYNGMELMGTQVAPDSFSSEGAFEDEDIAKERRQDKYDKENYVNNQFTRTTEQLPLKPSKPEVQRLEENEIQPDVRYHYRFIAADLAMKAASLLDDNTEELADVINTAGVWVKNRDEKLGNRYFSIIERRCSNTEIGKTAIAKHWFVDVQGPWSTSQQNAFDAMHKELDALAPKL